MGKSQNILTTPLLWQFGGVCVVELPRTWFCWRLCLPIVLHHLHVVDASGGQCGAPCQGMEHPQLGDGQVGLLVLL